jgi:isopenicillin N synthase-like dioxygenase
VGDLQFLRGGTEWVPVGPTRCGRLFINIGDQVEVVSGGAYLSVMHCVATGEQGRRLSVATFYKPAANAMLAPAREEEAAVAYPGCTGSRITSSIIRAPSSAIRAPGSRPSRSSSAKRPTKTKRSCLVDGMGLFLVS